MLEAARAAAGHHRDADGFADAGGAPPAKFAGRLAGWLGESAGGGGGGGMRQLPAEPVAVAGSGV